MHPDRAGATLLELMTAVTLLALIMGSIGGGLVPFIRALDSGQSMAQQAARAQTVIRELQDDCAAARAVHIDQVSGHSRCRFIRSDATVTWLLDGDRLLRGTTDRPPEARIDGVAAFTVEPLAAGYHIRLVLHRAENEPAIFQSAMATRLPAPEGQP